MLKSLKSNKSNELIETLTEMSVSVPKQVFL